MRLSSFDHSTPDAPFEAVDALFTLRAEIARLRELEAELCDEILTFASEQGCDKVLGAGRMAVIETRRPRRIAPEYLPQESLLNPDLFRVSEETVVLLAPRATGFLATQPVSDDMSRAGLDAGDADAPPGDLPFITRSESLFDPAMETDTEQTAQEVAEPMSDQPATPHDLAAEVIKGPSDTVPRLAEPDSPVAEVAGHLAEAPDANPAIIRTIGAPLGPKDGTSNHTLETSESGAEMAAEDAVDDIIDDTSPAAFIADPGSSEEPAISATLVPETLCASDPFVQAEDPFGLKSASPRAASPELPPVEAADATEGATPRDLRPTGHADLQPLAGLQEEILARMQADADAPLPPATLPDALDLARTLEAEADLGFGQDGIADDDTLPAAFSSRRLAIGGDG